MQNAILALLLLAGFLGAMAWFVVLGMRQARRAKALARRANETGMLFSAEDCFGLPSRYADFLLISGGHSGRACHVAHGRVGGLPVKVFDFHYELGHGTRRLAARCRIVSLETDRSLPPLLMWDPRQAVLAPLTVQLSDGRIGELLFRGRADLAAAVTDVWAGTPMAGACIESRGATLLLSAPSVPPTTGDGRLLELAGRVLAALLNASQRQ